jgi:hypothetical protein
MSAAVAGLVGALIGAAAGLAGAWLTSLLADRRERAKWILEARVDAYKAAIRHLYRAAYRMTEVSTEHGPLVRDEDISEWFDDVTESLYQVVWLTIVCGNSQLARVQAVQYDLDRAVAGLMGDRRPSHPKHLRYELAKAYQAIHVAARADLGGAVPELSREDLLQILQREAEQEAKEVP